MNSGIGQAGFADRVLSVLGKRRAVRFPTTTMPAKCYRPHRESFLSALLRHRNSEPPKGWCYFDNELLEEMAKARDALKKADG